MLLKEMVKCHDSFMVGLGAGCWLPLEPVVSDTHQCGLNKGKRPTFATMKAGLAELPQQIFFLF